MELVRHAAAILNAGGVLYLSTMEDDYANSRWEASSSGERMFIYYHEGAYLQKELEDNGFKIIDIQRKDFKHPDGSVTKDLVIVAGK